MINVKCSEFCISKGVDNYENENHDASYIQMEGDYILTFHNQGG